MNTQSCRAVDPPFECRFHLRWFQLLLVAVAVAVAAGRVSAQTSIFVALDGSARFKTVQEAIMSVPAGSVTNPVFIHIRPGRYEELIYIQHEKRFFHLVGEDPQKTVLTHHLNANLIGLD